MGFFGGLANITGLQAANIYNNPEQAAVGANTPESTYAMNKTVAPTLNKHYTPTVNMAGGYTQGEMQQNAAQGYDNTGAQAANAVGNAAAMYFTGGAATPLIAGQMAADRYSANNPNSNFAQNYTGIVASNPNINAGINSINNNVNSSLNAGVNQGYTMSRYRSGGLAEAAKHLERQGRGHDSHLVHMTSGELASLQKLAEQHGGSLTINPHTGLPEAGFLSSILPMVAGAAMVALAPETGGLSLLADPMIAGGIVGAADWAMTGSLKQGLMAGLGAWGGASMAGSLGNIGVEGIAQAGGDTANTAFQASQDAILKSVPEVTTEEAANAAAKQTLEGFKNLTPEQLQGFQGQLGVQGENAANVVKSAGALNAMATAPSATSLSAMGQGLSNSAGTGVFNSLSNAGNFVMNNKAATAGLAFNALDGMGILKQPTVPGVTQQKSNPFGMKTIPTDENGKPIFNASLPTQPNPHYQAQYPNYVQQPYNPYLARAKSGGLMDVHTYSGGPNYGSMVAGANEIQQGLNATNPQKLTDTEKALIEAGQEHSKAGVYHLSDIEYAKLTPANILKAHKIAVSKGIQPVVALGSYETTSSPQQAAEAMAKEDIAKSSKESSAKEGGLMAMATGGSTNNVYRPQYQNYAQTPLQATTPVPLNSANLQTANQAYLNQGIPIPTREAGIPAQGYKIDPMQMVGSPAYNQHQAELAAQAAADAQIAAAGYDYGAAAGGLMGYSHGGISNLGSYSDGGRLLKGPGDGVSDGIPATIGGKQPARLADGEFVIPARIVSELGNGSTDAGAKRLYAMMDRVKQARKKSKDIAADTKAYKYLPA
jgi:hypothetical protein